MVNSAHRPKNCIKLRNGRCAFVLGTSAARRPRINDGWCGSYKVRRTTSDIDVDRTDRLEERLSNHPVLVARRCDRRRRNSTQELWGSQRALLSRGSRMLRPRVAGVRSAPSPKSFDVQEAERHSAIQVALARSSENAAQPPANCGPSKASSASITAAFSPTYRTISAPLL